MTNRTFCFVMCIHHRLQTTRIPCKTKRVLSLYGIRFVCSFIYSVMSLPNPRRSPQSSSSLISFLFAMLSGRFFYWFLVWSVDDCCFRFGQSTLVPLSLLTSWFWAKFPLKLLVLYSNLDMRTYTRRTYVSYAHLSLSSYSVCPCRLRLNRLPRTHTANFTYIIYRLSSRVDRNVLWCSTVNGIVLTRFECVCVFVGRIKSFLINS